jgi:hypothetical protein
LASFDITAIEDKSRNHFLQQLKTSPAEVGCNDAEPGGIPAGPGKTIDEAGGDRIADDRHDDGYRARGVLERLGGWRPSGDNHIDLRSHELGSQVGQPVGPILSPFPLDGDGSSIDIPEVAQALHERLDPSRERVRGTQQKDADARHSAGLLRARRERPCRRTPEERDELATPDAEHRLSPIKA